MMMKISMQVLFWLTILGRLVYSELFTSLGHLTKIVESEAEIAKHLREYINNEREKLELAEK